MNRLRRLLRNRQLRIVATIFIVVLTLVVFAYYIGTHPAVLKSITELDAGTLTLLTFFYLLTVIANGFVLWASLRLLGTPVKFLENIVLTGYSSVVNFFGPLQSGPGFRAAYLKTKHDISIKKFFYVTLVFYGFFGLLNGSVITIAFLSSIIGGGYLALTIVGFAAIVTAVLVIVMRSSKFKKLTSAVKLNNANFWFIGLGALLLSLATAAVYFVELHHVDSSVSFGQAIIYTAAANLALFVSLTPGAIGFRESFLLLSQQLHGIASSAVISASIIDRAFYVVFLLVLFVVLLLVGARARFKKSPSQ